MLHSWINVWFTWVETWGYLGVFVLMAMESSIIPVPSEIVIPPAAFWAAQGKMDFAGVILAGTVGSWFGSAVSYWVSQWLGLPLLKRFGKFVLLSPEKISMAEAWVLEFGSLGIFVARLLPVVRHLISIPAGIFKMPFLKFSVVTSAGAMIWCGVLAWFGARILGDSPELLRDPDTMLHVLKAKLIWFVAAVVLFALLYAVMLKAKSRLIQRQT